MTNDFKLTALLKFVSAPFTITPPSEGVQNALANFAAEYHKQFPGQPADWETLTVNVYKTDNGNHYSITVGDPCHYICGSAGCGWVC